MAINYVYYKNIQNYEFYDKLIKKYTDSTGLIGEFSKTDLYELGKFWGVEFKILEETNQHFYWKIIKDGKFYLLRWKGGYIQLRTVQNQIIKFKGNKHFPDYKYIEQDLELSAMKYKNLPSQTSGAPWQILLNDMGLGIEDKLLYLYNQEPILSNSAFPINLQITDWDKSKTDIKLKEIDTNKQTINNVLIKKEVINQYAKEATLSSYLVENKNLKGLIFSGNLNNQNNVNNANYIFDNNLSYSSNFNSNNLKYFGFYPSYYPIVIFNKTNDYDDIIDSEALIQDFIPHTLDNHTLIVDKKAFKIKLDDKEYDYNAEKDNLIFYSREEGKWEESTKNPFVLNKYGNDTFLWSINENGVDKINGETNISFSNMKAYNLNSNKDFIEIRFNLFYDRFLSAIKDNFQEIDLYDETKNLEWKKLLRSVIQSQDYSLSLDWFKNEKFKEEKLYESVDGDQIFRFTIGRLDYTDPSKIVLHPTTSILKCQVNNFCYIIDNKNFQKDLTKKFGYSKFLSNIDFWSGLQVSSTTTAVWVPKIIKMPGTFPNFIGPYAKNNIEENIGLNRINFVKTLPLKYESCFYNNGWKHNLSLSYYTEPPYTEDNLKRRTLGVALVIWKNGKLLNH